MLGTFSGKSIKLKADDQKTGHHNLKNERKLILSSAPESLTYALIHLSAFWNVVYYLHQHHDSWKEFERDLPPVYSYIFLSYMCYCIVLNHESQCKCVMFAIPEGIYRQLS